MPSSSSDNGPDIIADQVEIVTRALAERNIPTSASVRDVFEIVLGTRHHISELNVKPKMKVGAPQGPIKIVKNNVIHLRRRRQKVERWMKWKDRRGGG